MSNLIIYSLIFLALCLAIFCYFTKFHCYHQYEIIKEIKGYDTQIVTQQQIPTSFTYILRCKKCGKLKIKRIKYE